MTVARNGHSVQVGSESQGQFSIDSGDATVAAGDLRPSNIVAKVPERRSVPCNGRHGENAGVGAAFQIRQIGPDELRMSQSPPRATRTSELDQALINDPRSGYRVNQVTVDTVREVLASLPIPPLQDVVVPSSVDTYMLW